MQSQFPRINTVAIICCAFMMYFTIVYLRLGIVGFIIGFMTRFLVELVWEIVYLYRHFPIRIRRIPSMSQIFSNLGANIRFSFVFAVGFSSEVILFEVVPFILFRSAHPYRNIALWMSLYQISGLSRTQFF